MSSEEKASAERSLERIRDRKGNVSSNLSSNSSSFRHKIPYRLLGRRSLGAKRLVVSSKVLLPAIPTENCDVVLTFPANTEDATLMWLLARFRTRAPAITVHVRHHSHTGIYGFYLTAPYDNLLQGAEELGLLKPLKSEYGGGMKEFIYEDHDCFAGINEETSFLTSQERQSIVMHFVNELRATGEDTLAGIKFVESQAIVPLLITKKVISQVFPLHNTKDLKVLRTNWVQAIFSTQPLDLVCRYFGVKIGLYFAFLGHYTTWLILPTLVGILIFFLQGSDQFTEDLCFVAFALFNVVWATLFMKFWSRASTEYCYRWGTLEKKDEMLKDPRPLFTGNLGKSPVTGHMEIQYPAWRRLLFRYCVTVPVIALCLALVFITMLLCFELQEWVNELIANEDLPSAFSFVPKVVLAIVVSVFDEIYKTIAIWLTNKENYRLEESHETSLIIKMVLFQFVNSFLSLFYIGFYLNDMDRLRDQLAALLITRQVLGNIKEALLPYIIWKARLYSVGYKMVTQMSPASVEKEVRKMTSRRPKRKRGAAKTEKKKELGVKSSDSESSFQTEEEEEGLPTLTQAEVESAMKTYEGTLDDYLEMSIQFGYITLFSPAFPLAAFCALVNNVIEIRSDAFKLCLTHQRPFGQLVHSIGIWREVLLVFSILAIIVNCALVGTSGLLHRMYPGLSVLAYCVIIVVIEHLIISLKFVLARSIPNMPPHVATEMARLEYQRTEALKQLVLQLGPNHSGGQHPQQSGGSPLTRRRKESGTNSCEDSPTVITPTTGVPALRPTDIPLSQPKPPKIPPRTSLQGSSTAATTNPFLANTSSPVSPEVAAKVADGVLEDSAEWRAIAAGIKPSRSSEGGSLQRSKRIARLRGEAESLRRRSEPVSSAVSTALNLHRQAEESTNLQKKSIYENQENLSDQNVSDEDSAISKATEIRRRKREEKSDSPFQRSSSLKLEKGSKISAPVTSLPPSIPSSSSSSYPSSALSLKYCASPRLLRGATLGEPSPLAIKVLSRKSRSFSSADVNEARQAFRDRLSWRGEVPYMHRSGKPTPVSQESEAGQDKPETDHSKDPHSKPEDAEGRPKESESQVESTGQDQQQQQHVDGGSPRVPALNRAVRGSRNQPLSISLSQQELNKDS